MRNVSRRNVLKVGTASAISVAATGAAHSEEVRPIAEQADPSITPLLAYFGDAEKAMNRYVSLFENSEIVEVQRYGRGEVGDEGTIKIADFHLNGHRMRCIDAPGKHDWTFTPAVSLYIESSKEEELAKYYEELSKNGKVLMPLDTYPWSKKFAWVEDEFGVSWQLNLSN